MKRYFALFALLSAPLFAMQPTNTKLLQAMLRNKSNVYKMYHNEILQQRFSSSNKDKNREERKKELVSQHIRLRDLKKDFVSGERWEIISKSILCGTAPYALAILCLDITEFAHTGLRYIDCRYFTGLTSIALLAGWNAVRKSRENDAILAAIKDAETTIATMEDVNKTSEISMDKVD